MKIHDRGKSGEEFAVNYLKQQGYSIVETNHHSPFGEIDIIAEDGDCLVFVEVKTRQEDGWDPFEAVHRRKRSHIVKVARGYLVDRFGHEDIKSRFDVLAVQVMPGGEMQGDLLKDAFMANE